MSPAGLETGRFNDTMVRLGPILATRRGRASAHGPATGAPGDCHQSLGRPRLQFLDADGKVTDEWTQTKAR
ncbi:hypothetical protein QE438_003360 [Pseudoxanthomonas sp. SORGH_AS 997]|uniref:Uncharacterized protein n=1 Tax=Pseudoxanthomonas winnipegensis TaxID=2480810 RepID=A0AAW8GHH4_9GAMM|nr:hypothetical protein [Pseudoxanthomonas winnipegensis]MDQ1133703.1 hypothetical protein [Pseudoxanthomonas winnipegensis]MDR6140056.1 hypothetical protein [Pseudoxanthomonas sp. SORGH_AS_0997]